MKKKKRKQCPQCRAKEPHLKFFIRHGKIFAHPRAPGAQGNNRVVFSRTDQPMKGFQRCKNEFHGAAW